MKFPSRIVAAIEQEGRVIPAVVSWHGRPLGRKKDPKNDGKRYAMLNGRRAHIARGEKALGRRLRGTELVHHVDPNDKYLSQGPLVVCPDQTYHGIIERRGRALRECGNANYRKCEKCGEWDDPANLKIVVRKRRNRSIDQERVTHYRYQNECVNKGDRADVRPYPSAGTLCKKGAGVRDLVRAGLIPSPYRSHRLRRAGSPTETR